MIKFESAIYYKSFGTAKQLPLSDLPEIAFSGRSNVGKSSLMNKIFNRKQLVRVSATPGKTITINFFKVDEAYFVDLPGYGYAKRASGEIERWSELTESYFTTNRNIKLIIQLIDMRHPPTALDIQMLEFIQNSGYNYIIVLSKSDKLNKTETEKRLNTLKTELSFLNNPVLIPFSALKNTGTEQIKEILNDTELS